MSRYYRLENGVKIYAGNVIENGDVQIINPTTEMILSAGYVEEAPTAEELLEQAKQAKLSEIASYDNSDAVNSFTVNGVTAWFTEEERKGYELSILSCETLGVTTISVPIAGSIVQMKVSDAKVMLAKIHLYADSCYMVTAQHKSSVKALTTKEAVEAYDYKVNYPDKLTLTI